MDLLILAGVLVVLIAAWANERKNRTGSWW